MPTLERTRTDATGPHKEQVRHYLATYQGSRPVRFTAPSREDAIQQALSHFRALRRSLSVWEDK